MQVVLVMFRSDGERRSFSVVRNMTVIGRREDCDLRIPVGDVSRKHCRLVRTDDGIRIEDLGSSNGTFVNGQRIQESELNAGDMVGVGPVQFVIQIDGVPDEDEISPHSVQPLHAPPAPPPLASLPPQDQEVAEHPVLEETPARDDFQSETEPAGEDGAPLMELVESPVDEAVLEEPARAEATAPMEELEEFLLDEPPHEQTPVREDPAALTGLASSAVETEEFSLEEHFDAASPRAVESDEFPLEEAVAEAPAPVEDDEFLLEEAPAVVEPDEFALEEVAAETPAAGESDALSPEEAAVADARTIDEDPAQSAKVAPTNNLDAFSAGDEKTGETPKEAASVLEPVAEGGVDDLEFNDEPPVPGTHPYALAAASGTAQAETTLAELPLTALPSAEVPLGSLGELEIDESAFELAEVSPADGSKELIPPPLAAQAAPNGPLDIAPPAYAEVDFDSAEDEIQEVTIDGDHASNGKVPDAADDSAWDFVVEEPDAAQSHQDFKLDLDSPHEQPHGQA